MLLLLLFIIIVGAVHLNIVVIKSHTMKKLYSGNEISLIMMPPEK